MLVALVAFVVPDLVVSEAYPVGSALLVLAVAAAALLVGSARFDQVAAEFLVGFLK